VGITQQIGASSLIKPGVIDNAAARPASPFEGQAVYQKDTDQVLFYDGSAWVETASMLTKAPRGIIARATSSTSYVLTTSTVIATGMTVTFTASANRLYKITYYEPQGQTSNVANSNSQTTLRITNASGTIIGNSVLINETANQDQAQLIIIKTSTFSAGSVTLVGCGITSNTSAAPNFIRGDGREALLLVEDIGAA
jgi:hypothetical protein